MKVQNGYDNTLGKKSFEKVKPALAQIPADRVQRVTVDLQSAAIISLHVASFVERPEIKASFLELPKKKFAPARLVELRDLGHATWYARTQAMADDAQASNAKAIAALLKDAIEVRQRMLRVVEYHFVDNPLMLAEAQSIRGGTGYQNVASDLTRVANLYEAHAKTLAHDGVWYRASDLATAREYAGEIIALIGDKGDADWADTLARLWTQLLETYSDVRRAAMFLFADEPAVLKQFPSLHAATRSKARSNGSGGDEVEVEIEDEAPLAPDAVTPAPALTPVASPPVA